MPKRNVLLLVVIIVSCLAASMAREQVAGGRRFGEVMKVIDSSYVDPVDNDALFDVAVDAMMAQLDEHSAYIRGDDRDDLEASLEQAFGGVGLELAVDEPGSAPIVASPVLDSPAWRAGIRAGDRIDTIDGQPTVGLSLREIVVRLRGAVGDPVVVGVTRRLGDRAVRTLDPAVAGSTPEDRREVTLVREEIVTESVLGDRRLSDGDWEWMIQGEPQVAIIRITTFGERTVDELKRALSDLETHEDLRGIILDLRGNPGGLLSAAVETCDLLLDEGVIVYTRRRRASSGEVESIEPRRATPGAMLTSVPIVVLVDGLTASAAEIVAACLQDAGRAVVAGSRTFGKGTVQSIVPLADDRGLLKITTSEYLRPSRDPIHRHVNEGDQVVWGVAPDPGLEYTPTAESLSRIAAWRRVRDAIGPVPVASTGATGLPRDIDPVLAIGLRSLRGAGGDPDLRGEEETPGHDDDAAGADA